MIFAKFVGQRVKTGSFTDGKIYFAKESYHYVATDLNEIRVFDDNNEWIMVNPKLGEFVFLDYIFAVWVAESNDDYLSGDTLTIDECDDDAFHIVGNNYMMKDNFEVIDSTNLRPDMLVVDLENGNWKKILRVNSEYGIGVDESNSFKEPIEFRFAVADKAIVSYPMLYCKNITGISLTLDKIYIPIHINGNLVTVENDVGEIVEYDFERFTVER